MILYPSPIVDKSIFFELRLISIFNKLRNFESVQIIEIIRLNFLKLFFWSFFCNFFVVWVVELRMGIVDIQINSNSICTLVVIIVWEIMSVYIRNCILNLFLRSVSAQTLTLSCTSWSPLRRLIIDVLWLPGTENFVYMRSGVSCIIANSMWIDANPSKNHPHIFILRIFNLDNIMRFSFPRANSFHISLNNFFLSFFIYVY